MVAQTIGLARAGAEQPNRMMAPRTLLLLALAMLAFAGNSLLCRGALIGTSIDAASFTGLRLAAGALTLCLLARYGQAPSADRGDWYSALALFVYAAGFSFAYRELSAATGALLLFAAVQISMLGAARWRGEQLPGMAWLGVWIAVAGLLVLLFPGWRAPPWQGALLMSAAGLAWGVYSLRARGTGNALAINAGNFLRTLPFCLLLLMVSHQTLHWDVLGVFYAIVSGAIASGLGYAIWYRVLQKIAASTAATVQLSVPVLTALAGVWLLGEALSWRVGLAASIILGGIALVMRNPPRLKSGSGSG